MIKTYSKSAHGNLSVSKNFQVWEFACSSSDVVLIDDELVVLLQTIRDYFGKRVTINSGYRTPEHNKKVGGATNSLHTKGMAADFGIKGVSPLDIAKFAEWCNIKGIGCYDNSSYGYFNHIDTRKQKYFWRNTNDGSVDTFGGTVSATPEFPYVAKANKRTRVRAGAGMECKHIRYLNGGNLVEVLGVSPAITDNGLLWYFVNVAGTYGFVYPKDLTRV